MLKRIIKKILKGIATFMVALILISCGLVVWMLFLSPLKPFDDARYYRFVGFLLPKFEVSYSSRRFNPNDIHTFTFDSSTVFVGSEELSEFYLVSGRNPGLGIRALHEQGITGAGVRVAIIDQNLALAHPEYKEKIAAYKEFGFMSLYSSMHGPAVASLLVGNESGTAPGAVLYYAGAPSWTGDSQYYADALRWIITENEKLPEGDKIRVVSVSAAPSGRGTPFLHNIEQWDEAVAEAKAAGILVLDCRVDSETGFINAAYFDPKNPDDIKLLTPGYPTRVFDGEYSSMFPEIFVPSSYRAFARENDNGDNDWMYTGQGGLSWAIPYVAGVLAMGWQINPNLNNDKIIQLLFETAYVNDMGFPFINPTDFIEAVIKY